MGEVVCAIDKAGFVHGAHEHLEPDDGVDDDDEDDKESDLDKRKKSHHNCIEHNLSLTFVFHIRLASLGHWDPGQMKCVEF